MSKRKAVLWEVSHSNVFKGYLFGTFHIGIHVVPFDLSILYDCLNRCSTFGAEVDLSSENISKMDQIQRMPIGQNWDDFIKPRQMERLQKSILKGFGIQLQPFKNYIPFACYNFICQYFLDKGQQQVFLDLHLWNFAKENELHLVGLEDFQNHMDVIRSISIDDQFKMLIKLGRNVKKSKKRLLKTLKLYERQDIHGLFAEARRQNAAMRIVRVAERNREILMRLEHLYLNNETVFAAVGVGHLSGEYGIIHLMKKLNYQLKPIHM